ncbi:phosphonate ABC transporter ATP-binding protein [Piscinibacterium candidicorallinum]|uniref:Phosphonate ABC transporter ATP-binding protein n=1 Tax=Piscinibacterium candidicorallinum TaxID=1793872 RepID=A0ABV7H4X5_9BURK
MTQHLASAQPDWLIQLRDVRVAYPGGIEALQRTQLNVAPGEFLVLLGASGAGKSTLLRCLNGLVDATDGTVNVHGLQGGALNPANLRAHRQRCGMVFQQHHLIGRETVLANVLMGCLGRYHALRTLLPWSRSDKLLALEVLDRVGLLEKALVRADTLSGGQQQRVGIARALIQRPTILLADEPVASLDPATAENVMNLLHHICTHDRLTAIVSLHQVALARRYADRIVGLRNGRVVFDGPPAALSHELQIELYGAVSAASDAPPHAARLPEPSCAAPVPALSASA